MEACKKFGLPPGCCVRWCLLEGPNGGYRLTVGGKSQPQKGDKKPKKGKELVRVPPQWEDDEEVARDVMLSVCVVPAKTLFTNEDDALQALKRMDEGHEDKGVGKVENAEVAEANEDNDKVAEATEDKENETVPDAEALALLAALVPFFNTKTCSISSKLLGHKSRISISSSEEVSEFPDKVPLAKPGGLIWAWWKAAHAASSFSWTSEAVTFLWFLSVADLTVTSVSCTAKMRPLGTKVFEPDGKWCT